METRFHELMGIDPAVVESNDLRQYLRDAVRWERRIAAVRLRIINELNRRSVWRDDGAGNAADWAAGQMGTGQRCAREQVEAASKLAAMPATSAALGSGELSVEQAAALATAVDDTTSAAFGADEEELLAEAKDLPPGAVQRLAQRWRREHSSADSDEQRHTALIDRRSGRTHREPDSMTVFKIESDPLSAAAWQPMLEATIAMLWRQDRAAMREAAAARMPVPTARTRAQLMHDAFVWLVQHGRSGVGAAGVTTPTELVVVLRENTWGRLRAELLDGSSVPSSVVDRLGISADVIRCVVNACGVPLDWGRTKRTATRDQRLALHLLYGGCVIPGCGAPFGATQAHHRVGFSRNGEEGPTDLANLVPACFSNGHHEDLDTGRLKLRVNPDSSIDILGADGRLVATRPPPTMLGSCGPPGPKSDEASPVQSDPGVGGSNEPERHSDQLVLIG